MVTFNFRLTDRGVVEYPLTKPEKLDTVLQQCAAGAGISLGGYIAVRKDTVITTNSLIDNADVIDIFPALSGG